MINLRHYLKAEGDPMESGIRYSSLALVLTTLGVVGARVVVSANGMAAHAEVGGHFVSVNGCETPANRIIEENCKAGNPSTEWDVNGAGDPTIQGFSTEMSVNVGELIEFKVKTDSPAYRVDIYRMGYYDGLGARLVATLKPSVTLPQVQPDCIVDYETRLYDCGNWQVSASWQVPSDTVSGVFIARLVREDPQETPYWRADNSSALDYSGLRSPKPVALPHAYGASGFGKLRHAIKEPRASQIVFVVRDDTRGADVLFQTSDPSWQAYNPYGLGNTYSGRTQWGSPASGESTGQANRAYKVSYNRPLINRQTGSVNQFFNAEYPMVRWLEANGYDTSYFSGVDSDRRGDQIKQHKLFLSVGHDEYWSAGHRQNVEAARDAGVHLAFLSGNEVFWKTRWEPSVDDSKTSHRTLVTYKETHSRITADRQLQPGKKLDPLEDVWTGTWRDSSSFNPEGAQPENALMGVIFTANAYRNDPLQVPATYGKLRFWRNTEIANLETGEKAVLGKGILGHEWDEDLDNGFRPAGLIHLSETTVHGILYIQDFGSVYDGGTGTHHLTLYRASSGALVFGAGTVQYSWGLDNFHDNSTGMPGNRANRYSIRVGTDYNGPVKALQQATVNLFADMDVQPSALQADLAPATKSSDALAPVSKILTPLDGADLAADVLRVTGEATDRGDGTVAGVEVSLDGGVRWHPTTGEGRYVQDLGTVYEWSYEVQVPREQNDLHVLSRATDDSANTETPSVGVRVVMKTSPAP